MSNRKNARFDAICILGTMRTGSNLLERIMSQNPEIVGAGELFNPNFIFRRASDNYHGISIEARNQNPEQLLARAIEVNTPRLPLFRYFPEQLPAARACILENPRIAKIILKRNPIDSYISVEIARRNTQWILTRRDKNVADVRFELSEAGFQDWLATSRQFYAEIETSLKAQSQDYYVVEYDNIKNYGMLDELAAFLDLGTGWPQFIEPLERQNPLPQESYLTNPEILKDIHAPIWQPRRIPNRLPKPLIAQSYFAKNLGLIYVPIFGNATTLERETLARANGTDLVTIKTEDIPNLLASNPAYRAYTRIIHPLDRIYTILMMHVFGETNGFDEDFITLANTTMEQSLKGYATEKSPAGLAEIGLKNIRDIRKLLRSFIIEVRKELWSGFRNHLLSNQYWPQALIVDNLAQNFEITTLIGDDFPNEGAFAPLASARAIVDPWLIAPIDARQDLRDSANVQIYDLYKEDFLTYGFPIQLD